MAEASPRVEPMMPGRVIGLVGAGGVELEFVQLDPTVVAFFEEDQPLHRLTDLKVPVHDGLPGFIENGGFRGAAENQRDVRAVSRAEAALLERFQ